MAPHSSTRNQSPNDPAQQPGLLAEQYTWKDRLAAVSCGDLFGWQIYDAPFAFAKLAFDFIKSVNVVTHTRYRSASS